MLLITHKKQAIDYYRKQKEDQKEMFKIAGGITLGLIGFTAFLFICWDVYKYTILGI